MFFEFSAKQTTLEDERFFYERGNLLLNTRIDWNDSTTNQYEYIYDPDGCLTGQIHTSSSTETNQVEQHTIDVESRQILRRNLNDGALRITTYTPEGFEHCIEKRNGSNIVTEVVYAKRLPNFKEYEFTTFDKDHIKIRTSQLKWNRNGLLREFRHIRHGTNDTTSITRYVHPEKDAAGNWIRRVARMDVFSKNKRPLHSEEISVREIEYYKPNNPLDEN